MSVHVVSYDLRKPGRDYARLYEALRSYTHCHALESTWLLDTSETATQVRDKLRQKMDANDGLLVTKMSGQWAAAGLNHNCASWLKKRFP